MCVALVYAVEFNLIISYVIVRLSRLCETVFQFFSSPLSEKEKEEEDEEEEEKEEEEDKKSFDRQEKA